MTKLIFTPLFAFIVFTTAWAQKDTAVFYINNAGKIVKTKDSADFIRVLISVDSATEKHLYNLTDLYMTGKPMLIAQTSLDAPTINRGLNGVAIAYFENGHKKSIKNFRKGRLIGHEVNYYPSGRIYTIKSHDDSLHTYLKECRDSTGKVLTEDGTGDWIVYTSDFKNIEQQGKVVKGFPDGIWKKRDQSTITYKYGDEISNFSDKQVFSLVEIQPDFPGGIDKFLIFIAKTIVYPTIDRRNNVQGRVIVTFIIEKDGSVSGVKALRGPDESLMNEGVRAVSLSPKWKPGMQNGRPVRVQFTVPINFALKR